MHRSFTLPELIPEYHSECQIITVDEVTGEMCLCECGARIQRQRPVFMSSPTASVTGRPCHPFIGKQTQKMGISLGCTQLHNHCSGHISSCGIVEIARSLRVGPRTSPTHSQSVCPLSTGLVCAYARVCVQKEGSGDKEEGAIWRRYGRGGGEGGGRGRGKVVDEGRSARIYVHRPQAG